MADWLDTSGKYGAYAPKGGALSKILKNAGNAGQAEEKTKRVWKAIVINKKPMNVITGLTVAGMLGNNVTKHHSDALEYANDAAGIGAMGHNLGGALGYLKKMPKVNANRGAAAGVGVGLLAALLTNKAHKKNLEAGKFND